MKRPKLFRATLERLRGNLRWTIARLAFDPTEVWPERNRMRVKGSIGKYDFRTSLFRDAEGYFLLVNKQMQKGAGVSLGEQAEFRLEPDLDERRPLVPPELLPIFREHRPLKKFYEQLSESARNDLYKWTTSPKSAESRVKRAEQLAERMMLTIEGERVVPPILEVAFRKRPGAREGWLAMTPLQRRGHLLGIFYYQGPEARAKRADKAVEEALRISRGQSPKGEAD